MVNLNERLELANDECLNIEDKIKENIFLKITSSKFHINIKKKYNKDMGKYMYVTDDCRDSFFVCKIINNELQKAFEIAQSNRKEILQGLYLLL